MRAFSPASMISTMVALSLAIPAAQAAPAQTNTGLTVTPTGTQAAETIVTLTAKVAQGAGPGGAAVPAGTVKFCVGTADLGKCNGHLLLGMAQLDTNGQAVWMTRPPLGSTPYYAVFLPTPAYATSASTGVAVAVNDGETNTTIKPATGTVGNYTLTAQVDGIGSRTAPTGSVNFQDSNNGFASVGTGPLGNPSPPALSLDTSAVYSSYNTGTNRLAVADFNKDGLPDMALTSNASAGSTGTTGNGITIYLGQPDGTMKQGSQAPIFISSIQNDITDIVAGDFTSTGNLDLVVTLNVSQQVMVVPGNGNGTFAAPSTGIPTGGPAQTLTPGDFDEDGKLDLAVGNAALAGGANGNVVFMKGNGQRSFTAGAKNTSAIFPARMKTTDLNKDGTLDLAIAELPNPNAAGSGKLTALIGAGDGTFTAKAGWDQTAGSGPQDLVVDDFNNDGVPDVLVPSTNDKTTTMFLGVPATLGTFTSQTLTNMATQYAEAVASADFDRDGNADVAVLDWGANTVTVLTGAGDGKTFTSIPQGPFPLGGGPAAVVASDVNGDGVPDLLAVNSNDNTASVVPVILATSATATKSGVSVIGTGTHNIVASYIDDTLYRGSVSQNFDPLTAEKMATSLNLDAIQPPTAMQKESVVLTAEITPAQAQGFEPGGNVTFTANPGNVVLGQVAPIDGKAVLTVAIPTSLAPGTYTVVANYAGDTNFAASNPSNTQPLRIILPPPPTNTVLSFANTGTSSLATLTAKVTDKVSGNPVTAGTVNFCAVVASYCTGANLIGSAQLDSTGTARLDTYLVGEATNWFRADFLGTVIDLPSSSLPEAAPEVDVARYLTMTTMPTPTGSAGNWKLFATVQSFVGTQPQGQVNFTDQNNNNFLLGSQNLGTPTTPIFGFTGELTAAIGALPSSIAVGDFNSDHHLDLAATNPGAGTVTLLKGDGHGAFTALTPGTLTLAGAQYVASADFDNDGMLDLMVAESAGNKKVMPYKGAGNGTFTAQTEQSSGNVPSALTVADFDGDGLLDMAIVSQADNNVAVLLNQGTFGFTAAGGSPYALGSGTGPTSATARDLDNDGIVDLAVANAAGKSISVLKGKGDGTLQAAATQAMTPAHSPQTIVVGDFNGDGHLDLATANNDATVSAFIGQGHLAFTQADTPVTGAGQTNGLAAGDFNGDGYQDLAVSDATKFVLAILLGQGDGTFPAAGQKSSTAGTTAGGFLAIGDFDETGQLDAVMANSATTGARVIRPQTTATATAELDNVAVAGTGTAHTIGANYLGNTRYLPSPASGTLPGVTPAPLTSTVQLFNVPQVLNTSTPVTLTAQITVTPSTQNHAFTGTVQFYNATTQQNMGTPQPVTPTGIATYTTARGNLVPLTNQLQAKYSGDANFAAGTGTSSIFVQGHAAAEPAASPQPRASGGAKAQKTKM